MQSHGPAKTVICVSTKRPEAAMEQEMEARGVRVQWASSIKTSVGFLNSAIKDRTVVITELALADGNWRDLVERIRSLEMPIPIMLVTSASTAELWWDALECGVEDILQAPLSASQLCQFLNERAAREPDRGDVQFIKPEDRRRT
jgi:DNA-binding NtrC family response regulator